MRRKRGAAERTADALCNLVPIVMNATAAEMRPATKYAILALLAVALRLLSDGGISSILCESLRDGALCLFR